MILSPLFVKEYDGLDARTTFYFEEWILFAKLFSKNQLSLYSPNLQVLHDHGKTTKFTYTNHRKRYLFIYKNFIHGLETYRQVLKELPVRKSIKNSIFEKNL